jgi:hypothetical protein
MTAATLTFWMDRPVHGTEEHPNAGNFTGGSAYCSDCRGPTAAARIIALANGKGGGGEGCDSRCLNGRRSCAPSLHPTGVGGAADRPTGGVAQN